MIDVLKIANKITLIHINTMTTYRIPEEAERMIRRTEKKRKMSEHEPTPLQTAVREFDGRSYFDLTSEEIRIFEVMRTMEFVQYNDRGEITATERGRGIIDGSIETNYVVPGYLAGYLAKSEEASKCGTAGSQP